MTDLVDFASEGSDKGLKFIMPLVKNDTTACTKGEVIQVIMDSLLDITKLWSCYEEGDIPF